MRITFDQGLFFILYILYRYVAYPYSKKVSSFIAQGHRLEASWLRVELKCSARCMHFSHLGQTAVIHSYRGVRIIFLEASSGSKMLRLEFWRWFAQEMALVRECTLASVYWLPRKSRIDFKILALTCKVLRGQVLAVEIFLLKRKHKLCNKSCFPSHPLFPSTRLFKTPLLVFFFAVNTCTLKLH